jgi:glyoxylase-like metal-dependent hydrolase (beta-lactamase superfamily II)
VIVEGRIQNVGAYRITPLDLGTLTIPAGTPMGGHVLPVRGYVVQHPHGTLLFDTGLGDEHAEFDAKLNPTRRALDRELSALGIAPADINCVANCHLHYDHCGGNPLFAGVPTYVQQRDYDARYEINWYIDDRVRFPSADLHLIDGEHEVLPGLRLVPTPGHTPGHQSLVIEDGQGLVILAGQAAYTAAEFADPRAEPARGWKTASDGEAFLSSLAYLHSLRPRLVYFAHDSEYWEP